MNNLLTIFEIKIDGQFIDPKHYLQYSDYQAEDGLAPSDNAILAKTKAYIVYKQLTRILSEYAVPTYFNIEFDTVGDAATIPTNATINVGYIGYNGFVTTVEPINDRITVAIAKIKEIVENVFKTTYTEIQTVQETITRSVTNLPSSPTINIVGFALKHVETDTSAPTVTVKKVDI